ncbi:ent-kaurenoic acid oxidase [Medicago truncatula]|uniref:Ent-kaurenoic acid oxidase n=1 Tax=Medicago truncatula TaxID=3880 RepID=G7KVU2_MEDTR|nr:ent-kaurenoic acid oxidase [Medicago truncatula]
MEVIGFKSFWSYDEKEHKGLKRLVSALTMGHNTLEMYLPRIEDIVINSLEKISSMNHLVTFLKEMKSISFDIIISIIMGSYNKHILTKIENSFSYVFAALYCMSLQKN